MSSSSNANLLAPLFLQQTLILLLPIPQLHHPLPIPRLTPRPPHHPLHHFCALPTRATTPAPIFTRRIRATSTRAPPHHAPHTLTPLPPGDPAIPLQPEHAFDLGNLGMIARVPHAMDPAHLATIALAVTLDHELAADLPVVATLEGIAAGAEALDDGLHGGAEDAALDVVGLGLAEVEGADHAELLVERAVRVAVDGVRAGRGFGVDGDELGLAAADDGDGGGDGEVLEGAGGDGGGEGAKVFLAVLWGNCQMMMV